MLIRKLDLGQFEDMGECQWQLLYPWEGVTDTPFYSGWTYLKPGKSTPPHQHHEYETYFIARGHGEMRVEGEATPVDAGDVIYMPPFNSHVLVNTREGEDLLFLSVFWEDLSGVPEEKKASEERERAARCAVLTAAGPETGEATRRAVALAADAHRRYLAQRGVEVVSVEVTGAEAASTPRAGEGRTLSLAGHAATLKRFHLDSRIPPALRAVAEHALAADDPEVPVSAADESAAARWAELDPEADATVFVTRADAARATLGIPALALGAGAPREALPTALVVIDEPAVGAHGALGDEPSEAVRWCLAAGEADPDAARRELDGWRRWLGEMHGRLRDEYGGKVPSTGFWTDEQHQFHRRLLGRVARVADGYEARSFSLPRVVRELRDLVWDARRFAADEVVWIGVPERSAERRTSVALELTAARALAYLAAPLLPELTAELWGSLHPEDADQPSLSSTWEEVPGWVSPGSELSSSAAGAAGAAGAVGAGEPAGT
jgi:mannose-6-phosphate isomerase-like protein (cupin superfamily)